MIAASKTAITSALLPCMGLDCPYTEEHIIRFTAKRIMCADRKFAILKTTVILLHRKTDIPQREKEIAFFVTKTNIIRNIR